MSSMDRGRFTSHLRIKTLIRSSFNKRFFGGLFWTEDPLEVFYKQNNLYMSSMDMGRFEGHIRTKTLIKSMDMGRGLPWIWDVLQVI